MKEDLVIRKAKAREFLKDAYRTKKMKWFQTVPTYEMIIEEPTPNKSDGLIDKEIIIRNDLKGALKGSAFFMGLSCLIFIFFREESIAFLFMFSIFVALFLIGGFDRKPKLIINSTCFWGYNFENAILWENIIAIYYKTEELSDSNNYSLMVHYYDAQVDYFKEIEFKLHGYEMGNDEIIKTIQKFSINNI